MVLQGENVVLVQGQARRASQEGWPGQRDVQSVTLVPQYSCVLCWTPREKSSVEDEIKEKEEAVRQHSDEVQVTSRCSSNFVGKKHRPRRVELKSRSITESLHL